MIRDIEAMLKGAGLTDKEIRHYMQLDCRKARLELLDKLRSDTLDDIHAKEKRLELMDILRCELREEIVKE